MKKIILSVLSLVMSASMAFGYVQVSDLLDTLTTGNQFKARLNQVGVLAGTEELRFSVGATVSSTIFGNGAATSGDKDIRLVTSPFVSFGYKTPAFGVAVGYQFQNFYQKWTMHAPAVALTFMENNLRILIPVRIGVANKKEASLKGVSSFDLGPDGVWVRYHTGVEALPQVRLYVKYGSTTYKPEVGDKVSISSLGVQLRAYLKKFMAGDVGIQPLVRVQFDTSISENKDKYGWYGSSYNVAVNDAVEKGNDIVSLDYKNPMHIQVRFPVEFTAANDFMDFTIVPDLRFDVVTGKTDNQTSQPKKVAKYSLGYNFYSEINFYATETLSFYLESDIGGNVKGDGPVFAFAANAGMTWKF